MWKLMGAVVAGYLTMFVLVFTTFTGAYLTMGAEGAFAPGSYEVTGLWLLTSMALGFVAALAGGLVCWAIARQPKATLALAGFVLVLGLLMALPMVMQTEDPRPTVREGSVGNFEAMQNARQPAWVALLNPFVGAIGVLLGGRLKGGSR